MGKMLEMMQRLRVCLRQKTVINSLAIGMEELYLTLMARGGVIPTKEERFGAQLAPALMLTEVLIGMFKILTEHTLTYILVVKQGEDKNEKYSSHR
jgi:hypothetical protein